MSATSVQLWSSKIVPGTPPSEPGDWTRWREKVGESPSKRSSSGGQKRRKNKLCNFPPRDVAEEMTLLDAGLLRLIKASELENGAWMKKDKDQRAPNIMAMVKSFNNVALLVPTEILEEATPHARAKVISTYIKVAQECYCHGNYNSLKAVLAGLQSTPIFRLAKTWKEVSSRKRKKFEELSKVMHEDNNWSMYRKEISKKLQKNHHFVPFLGIFLTTTAFAQTLSASHGDKAGSPSKDHLDVVHAKERRVSTESMYETYHLLEAITVREKLDKLRRGSVTLSPGQLSISSIGSDRTVSGCDQNMPPPVANGGLILLTETPPTTPSAGTTCRSCGDPHLLWSGDCSEHAPLASPSFSTVDIMKPVDDVSLTSSSERRNHSASEGNVLAIRIVSESSRGISLSANTSPARDTRRNLERSLEDEVDSCMGDGGTWDLGLQRTSPQHKGKKMRVTQGISKTAKFFAMLRSRYRNGMSSTVGSGLGDIVMDKNAKLTGSDEALYSQHCKKHKRTTSKKHGDDMPLPKDAENVVRSDGRRPSGCGLFRSNSQHEALSRCVRSNLNPGEEHGGELNRMLSGSLEGLLTAVNTRLSGEWSSDVNSCYDDDEEKRITEAHIKISHCPSAMTSLDTSDDNNLTDGNSVSLTSSFSSPSLKSLMDQASRTSTSRHLRPASVSGPSGGKDSERLGESNREEKGADTNLELAKKRHGSAGDSLSRTPSSSSMESAGSCQSQNYLPSLHSHRRNSSDPNSFVCSSLPPKMGAELTVTQVTPPSASLFGIKNSSPLIRSFTRQSPGMIHPSHGRRSGHCTSSVISQGLLLEEGEESLSPQDLLHQYQFLSLGCCYSIESKPLIHEIITSGQHNSEALNYKLSYTVEPD